MSQNLLQEAQKDFDLFKEKSLSIKDVLLTIKASDNKIHDILNVFNARAVLTYIVLSKKYKSLLSSSDLDKGSPVLDELKQMAQKTTLEIMDSLNTLPMFKKKPIFFKEDKYDSIYNKGGHINKTQDISTGFMYIKKDCLVTIELETSASISFDGKTHTDANVMCELVEKTTDNALFQWLVAHYYAEETKSSVLSNITKQTKHLNLSVEQIEEKVEKCINRMVECWELQKDQNILLENFIPRSLLSHYSYNDNLTPYMTDGERTSNLVREKRIEAFADLCNIYNKYGMYVHAIPRTFDENALVGVKILVNKWGDVSNELMTKPLPEILDEKDRKKAVNDLFRTVFALHKMQEFALKAQSPKQSEFNDYLMETLPDYAKKFKKEPVQDIVFSENIMKSTQLTVSLDVELKDFTEKTGFTRTDIENYLKILSDYFWEKDKDIDCYLGKKKNGFELIAVFPLKGKELISVNDFSEYLGAHLYNHMIKALTFLKEQEENLSYELFKKNKDILSMNSEAEKLISWIREDKLLEKIEETKIQKPQVKKAKI